MSDKFKGVRSQGNYYADGCFILEFFKGAEPSQEQNEFEIILPEDKTDEYLREIARRWNGFSEMEKEVERLNRLVYVPGLWRCAKCEFNLIQATMNASSGTVTARNTPGAKCPNCESPLWRVTEREAGNKLIDEAYETSDRIKELEAENAKLKKRVEELMSENKALGQEIHGLWEEKNDLAKRVAHLEECTNWDIENALAEADDYKRKCDALEEKVKEFEKLKSEGRE